MFEASKFFTRHIFCRGMQIKVEKPKFLAASHLKPAQWKELEVEFEKFAKASGLILDKANKQKKNDFTKFVDKQNSGMFSNYY